MQIRVDLLRRNEKREGKRVINSNNKLYQQQYIHNSRTRTKSITSLSQYGDNKVRSNYNNNPSRTYTYTSINTLTQSQTHRQLLVRRKYTATYKRKCTKANIRKNIALVQTEQTNNYK